MIDHFALLNQLRLPWIAPESLKERFLALSSEAHPDRQQNRPPEERVEANRRFAELNAAYTCLRETKDRLLHLIELETGAKPKDVQRIPPGTMDLFTEVGQTCRDADAFLEEKNRATSPLVKVQHFEKGMGWTDKLGDLQQILNAKRDQLDAELKQINPVFESVEGASREVRLAVLPIERLEQIYRTLSYLSRWSGQIQERIVQLSL